MRRHHFIPLFTDAVRFLTREIAAPLIEAILPADCPGCERPLPGINRAGLCDECWERIRPVPSPLCPRCGVPLAALLDALPATDRPCARCLHQPPPFDGARCALVFEGPVRALLHLFKFDQRRDLARPLAKAILAALPPEERFDLIVPVPLHWTRRWRRGYNQAALLARAVGRAARADVAENLLVKRRRTADQASLDAARRRKNLAGAFTVRARTGLCAARSTTETRGRVGFPTCRTRGITDLGTHRPTDLGTGSLADLGMRRAADLGTGHLAAVATGHLTAFGIRGLSSLGARFLRALRMPARLAGRAPQARPSWTPHPRLAGSRVLLVDDVLTTGATAAECARALKSAGAARVFVVAVARTPPPGQSRT